MKIPKTPETQKAGYDEGWGNLLSFINQNHVPGHPQLDNFNDLYKEWEAVNGFEMNQKPPTYTINQVDFHNPSVKQYVDDKAKYLQDNLSKCISKDTEYLVDLGSGWGRNSISFHLKYPNQQILAGELSDSGQKVLSYFIKKYNLPIESFPFNWLDFTSLISLLKTKNPKKITIFSNHSIEQIPYLKVEEFKKLLDLPIKIKGFHIEPVGFQWDNPSKSWEWTMNFKNILDELESKKLIKTTKVDTKNCYKATKLGTGPEATLITWEKL